MLGALGIDGKKLQEAQQDIVREDVILFRAQLSCNVFASTERQNFRFNIICFAASILRFVTSVNKVGRLPTVGWHLV